MMIEKLHTIVILIACHLSCCRSQTQVSVVQNLPNSPANGGGPNVRLVDRSTKLLKQPENTNVKSIQFFVDTEKP